jgi:hypothetical protein
VSESGEEMVTSEMMAAPCGVDCSTCPLHLAISDEALKQRLAEVLNLPQDKMGCGGCRKVDGNCPVIPEQCATWLSVKEKGVDFCSDCSDFPCTKLAPCADKASTRPHNIKVFSLTLRRNKGAEEWGKRIKDIYALYFDGEMAIGHGPVIKK